MRKFIFIISQLFLTNLLLGQIGLPVDQSKQTSPKEVEPLNTEELNDYFSDRYQQPSLPTPIMTVDSLSITGGLEGDSAPRYNTLERNAAVFDEAYNLGFKQFKEAHNVDDPEANITFREARILNNYKRALALFVLYEGTLQKNIETYNIKFNTLSFGSESSVDIILAEHNDQDEALLQDMEAAEELRKAALMYYNRVNSDKKAYFPLLDWKLPRSKTDLTELFFTNQFGDSKVRSLTGTLFTLDFNNQASVYTEIVSSYIGPGKIAIAGLLSTDKLNTPNSIAIDSFRIRQESAIQRLIGGGGNIGISYQVPFVHGKVGRFLTFGSILTLPRIGTELPEINQTVTDPTFQVELNHQAFFYVNTSNSAIGLYGSHKLAWISGNDNYRDLIQRDNILYNQFTVGLTINETIRIGLNLFSGSEFVRDAFPESTLSFTIVPR